MHSISVSGKSGLAFSAAGLKILNRFDFFFIFSLEDDEKLVLLVNDDDDVLIFDL